jgi:AcrR family transcriptional regulator
MKAGQNRTPKQKAVRAGRRERRKLATRAALLDATRELLCQRSMDALSVDEIVERADVARGTFYNYFPDKDALERELASRTRARVEDEIARVNEAIKDPAQRIARAFCSVLRWGITGRQDAAAMMRLFPHATDPAAPINSGVRRDAAEGMTQGRIVAAAEDVVVAYVMGLFVAGLNRVLDLPAERVQEFALGLGTMLIHGLGVKRLEADRIAREAVESILV